MEWLNYHHLYYFWRVATLGSISSAASELRLQQPTISAQLSAFEASLGKKLFERRARKLTLTEEGHLAFRYAEEIFSTGRELVDVLNEKPVGHPVQCIVGVVDVMPKLMAYKFLEPILKFSQPSRIECHEDSAADLLLLLASHKLDLVISDTPIPSGMNLRGFNHLIGESKIGFFAKPDTADRLRRNFPRSLEGQNILLPLPDSALRRNIDRWMEESKIRPVITGEFEDSALMKSFAESGYGVFPAPIAIGKEIERRHKVKLIRAVPDIVERFYAISLARRIQNPLIELIVTRSKEFLRQKGG